MTSSFRLLLVLGLAAGPAALAAASPAPEPGSLRIRFEPLDAATHATASGDAFVDLGTMSARDGGEGAGIVVRRRVAVRVEAGPGGPSSARLTVALGTETPGCTVRVDGVTLTSLPRVLDPVHRVGTAAVHEIEVIIPASGPPGSFVSDLRWRAEAD